MSRAELSREKSEVEFNLALILDKMREVTSLPPDPVIEFTLLSSGIDSNPNGTKFRISVEPPSSVKDGSVSQIVDVGGKCSFCPITELSSRINISMVSIPEPEKQIDDKQDGEEGGDVVQDSSSENAVAGSATDGDTGGDESDGKVTNAPNEEASSEKGQVLASGFIDLEPLLGCVNRSVSVTLTPTATTTAVAPPTPPLSDSATNSEDSKNGSAENSTRTSPSSTESYIKVEKEEAEATEEGKETTENKAEGTAHEVGPGIVEEVAGAETDTAAAEAVGATAVEAVAGTEAEVEADAGKEKEEVDNKEGGTGIGGGKATSKVEDQGEAATQSDDKEKKDKEPEKEAKAKEAEEKEKKEEEKDTSAAIALDSAIKLGVRVTFSRGMAKEKELLGQQRNAILDRHNELDEKIAKLEREEESSASSSSSSSSSAAAAGAGAAPKKKGPQFKAKVRANPASASSKPRTAASAGAGSKKGATPAAIKDRESSSGGILARCAQTGTGLFVAGWALVRGGSGLAWQYRAFPCFLFSAWVVHRHGDKLAL